jgi:hypothetical protein
MNSSAPNRVPLDDPILKSVRMHVWRNRALVAVAFALGFVAIVLSIAIAWGNFMLVIPQLVHLLQAYPHDRGPGGPNDLDWQHVQVSAALGKTSVMVAASVAFLGLGTLVTLLLVIFNRRVTLQQINASLAQLSQQIKELQGGKSSNPTE